MKQVYTFMPIWAAYSPYLFEHLIFSFTISELSLSHKLKFHVDKLVYKLHEKCKLH